MYNIYIKVASSIDSVARHPSDPCGRWGAREVPTPSREEGARPRSAVLKIPAPPVLAFSTRSRLGAGTRAAGPRRSGAGAPPKPRAAPRGQGLGAGAARAASRAMARPACAREFAGAASRARGAQIRPMALLKQFIQSSNFLKGWKAARSALSQSPAPPWPGPWQRLSPTRLKS